MSLVQLQPGVPNIMNFDSDSHHFDCDCSSAEHIFRVTSQNNWDSHYPPDLNIFIQLNKYKSLYRRFVIALRYFFGYQCKFGHWDVVTLKEDDLNRLIVLLHQHRVKLQRFYSEKENKNAT